MTTRKHNTTSLPLDLHNWVLDELEWVHIDNEVMEYELPQEYWERLRLGFITNGYDKALPTQLIIYKGLNRIHEMPLDEQFKSTLIQYLAEQDYAPALRLSRLNKLSLLLDDPAPETPA